MSVIKDPAGNPAPTGGFSTGGWYSGFQYWNGTFASQAGQIHPASNQQGAGETVSEEVNIQGDIAQGLAPGTNQAYINQQNQQQQPQPQQQPQTPSTPASASTGTPGTEAQPEEAIDLTGMYKGLQESSGVTGLQDEYLEKERQFIEAKNKINDNPFLSEATRVGREAKLTKLFNERTANLQDEIAMKKADIETQLNLQVQQLDMNSEATQRNIDNLNNLISMGAFDGASGETIAEWTRMTGVSSDLIMSAVKAQSKTDVDTQVITSTADSGEVTVSVINSQTGEIINQSSLGNVGNAEGGGGGGGDNEENANRENLVMNIKEGHTLRKLIERYGVSGGLSIDEIYRLYNANSPWGEAKEELPDIKLGKYQDEQD